MCFGLSEASSSQDSSQPHSLMTASSRETGNGDSVTALSISLYLYPPVSFFFSDYKNKTPVLTCMHVCRNMNPDQSVGQSRYVLFVCLFVCMLNDKSEGCLHTKFYKLVGFLEYVFLCVLTDTKYNHQYFLGWRNSVGNWAICT